MRCADKRRLCGLWIECAVLFGYAFLFEISEDGFELG
jgi:hypothetical protein